MQKLFTKKLISLLCILGFILSAGCASVDSTPGQQERVEQAVPRAPTQQPEVAKRPEVQMLYKTALKAMQDGNLTRAKQILIKMTVAYPELAGPYVNLGIVHFRSDEIDSAEEVFNKALKINPNSAVSYNHLGIIYRGKGKFKEAKASYEQALQIQSDYGLAHLNYGILLDLYTGELEKALEHYKRYLELTDKEDKKVEKWIVELERRINSAKR